MKNRGIWFTICVILVAGIGLTSYTSQVTHQKEIGAGLPYEANASYGSNLAQTSKEEDRPLPAGTGRAMAQGGTERADMTMPETDAATQEEAVPGDSAADQPKAVMVMEEAAGAAPVAEDSSAQTEEEAGASMVIISPLTGSIEAAPNHTTIVSEARDYSDRLEELDNQIAKRRSEETDSTTASIKAAAEYEYRVWDGELNEVYQVVITNLPEEDQEKLKLEEKEWLKKRDATAKEASSKYSGGTLESVEYIASMAAATRERTYYLVEIYEEVLNQ